jgi:membrane-associated protein
MGGASWVTLFLWGGFLFGNIPLVKQNFGLVTIFIVVASLVPVAIAALRRRFAAR